MTPTEHKTERDKRLAAAAKVVAEALPGHYGSVRVNLQDGRAVNINVEETIRLPADDRVGHWTAADQLQQGERK